MDRTKRASQQESEMWANPCDYNKSSLGNPLKYDPELANRVVVQARDTIGNTRSYQDEIMALHNFGNFTNLNTFWAGTEWLRNFPWFKEAGDMALPESKQLTQPVDENLIRSVMTTEGVDALLPVFGKALAMLGAGLRAVGNSLRYPRDDKLKQSLMSTSDNVRHVLCMIHDLIRSRPNVEKLLLLESEIPQYTSHDDAVKDAFLIYRDTLNFLEYIEQFFDMLKGKNVYN